MGIKFILLTSLILLPIFVNAQIIQLPNRNPTQQQASALEEEKRNQIDTILAGFETAMAADCLPNFTHASGRWPYLAGLQYQCSGPSARFKVTFYYQLNSTSKEYFLAQTEMKL